MSHQNGPAAGSDTPGGPGQAAGGTGLAVLPAIWVGLNVALAGWGIMGSWRATFDYEIPDSVLYLVYAGLIAGIVNILWGLYLIGLAVNRSDRFPRQFTIWQVANILWIAAREAYVLVTPDFVPTIQSLLFAAAEIAIGVFCILLLRRKSETAQAYSNAGSQRPPVIVSIIAGFLGVVVGGALGFGAGLLGGGLIAEVTDMSCFEGACGYFAFFIGLFAMLAGAVAGAVFAVWRVNRLRKPRAA
jgi:hypothetical protein